MSNPKETVFSIIGGIILLVVFIPMLMDNPQTIDDVQYAIKEICGIDKKVLDALDDSFSSTLDGKGKQVYWDLLSGNDVSKCDVMYFFNQIDDTNRKNINLKQLTCNISSCLDE